MEEVRAGIREEELGSLAMEVMDYAGDISSLLGKVDEEMNSLKIYYEGPPCDKIIARYNELKASFSNIKYNITSYSDDFITLINKMHESDTYLSRLFQDIATDLKTTTKTINQN